MAVGKFVSLEEVRRNPRLLGRFIKERLLGGHAEADADLFDGTLKSMVRNSPEGEKTSPEANGEGCSETQIRQGTSEDASL